MSQFILTAGKVWADSYDVSAYCNTGEIQKASDMHDVTAFGATEHRWAPGLQGGNWSLQGFTEFGTSPHKIEKIIATLGGVRDKPLTVVPEGGTVGNIAIFLPAAFHGSDFGGPHGNPNTFNWQGGTSKWQPVSGFLDEPGTTARVATGNTTGQLVAAVPAGQYLYAAVHVLAATGTMDLIVQSAVADTFAGATTRITFTQFTAVGSSIMRVAGPITDTYYRFQYTLGGGPSFTFAASFGIAG